MVVDYCFRLVLMWFEKWGEVFRNGGWDLGRISRTAFLSSYPY